MKNRPALGQWVTATDRMYRKSTGPYYNTKTWVRWGAYIPGGAKPVEGIFIGSRTIQDGDREWAGEDCGNIWIPSKYKEAWLIVEDSRHVPVRVFPEDVTCHD